MINSFYRISDIDTKNTYANKVLVASDFFDRLMGLMFKESLLTEDNQEYEALLIESCNSIHTCFMKFPIDVVFLTKENRVHKIIKNLKPWRITPIYLKATKVLEFKSGTLTKFPDLGNMLELELCTNLSPSGEN